MRTVLIASLRAHTRRYVAAFVAVTIAVGFVVVTNALASATKAGLSQGVDDAYPASDLVVGERYGISEHDLRATLETARREGDTTSVIANGWLPVRSDDRTLGSEVTVGTVSTDDTMRRQDVTTGRAPRSDREALVDRGAAKADGIAIGDVLTLGSGPQGQEVTVVGLADSVSYLGADVYVPWPTLSRVPGAQADAVSYRVGDGAVGRRTAQLEDVVDDAQVRTRPAYVDDRVTMVNQGVDVISYLLLLFAAIAAFVAVLVIANTFTILFAQRTRDFALLRCVGATGRQVLRSVRVESFALAVVASVIGVVGGAGAGYGLTALVRAFAGPERIGAVSLSPSWLVAAFVGGVVVTWIAAWWPTRAVTRVSPLAALRPAESPGVRSRGGRVRAGLGLAVVAASTAVLVGAVTANSLPVLLVGGMASFVGVLLLGPVIVPALLRAVGRLLRRTGPSLRIASANAVRNPRRSAATTASLLVGVTLTTAVLTGMASARGAIESQMDAQHPVDVALTGETSIGAATLRQVADTRGVTAARAVNGVVATAKGLGSVPVLGPDETARRSTLDPAALHAVPGRVLVPPDVLGDLDGEVPDRLTLDVDGRRTTLPTRVVGSEWGRALVVNPATLRGLGGDPAPLAVWVQAADGTDPDTLGGDLGAVARDADLDTTNALKDRAYVDLQLDVLVYAVLGLLGIAVAIALVGIANTVGLSVLERGREHALLRALGLTRRQLRRVLAAEGLLLAVVAAVIGTVLGTAYGWLGVLTIVRTAVPDAPLVMPWTELGAVVVVAALAGLAACVLPARRAARIAPAQGLTLD